MTNRGLAAARSAPSQRTLGGAGAVLAAGLGCLALAQWVFAPDSLAHHAALVASAGAVATAAGLAWSIRPPGRTAKASIAAAETERTQARAEAALQAARVQAIVDTANEGIVTIDAHGRIETANGAAERLFGYREAELIGQNVRILMPSPFREEHDDYLQRYLESGQKRVIGIGRQVVGQRRDGSTFPLDLSVGEGWIEGERFFTAVLRDVTDRQEMQAKLAQAERLAAVGELAAGVAHEVNNPINTMINCAQLIQDGDDPQSNCRIIIEEGQRIAEIVKDLLQFARDDRDRPQTTSVADAVARTLRLIGESFQRHGVRLDVAVPESLPPVKARPQQLQQVLLNLLINAKDALLSERRDDRRVEVSAAADAGGVAMLVADNGPGIPEHLGNRVFEPFVTTKRGRGGTGLGLSISKGIVEGYGGTIEIASRPGEGARFRVWLPQTEGNE